MNIPKPIAGSLVVENQQTAADRDAAAVLDPDTFVAGAPFDALTRLRADSPVHPVQLPGLPRAWLLTKHADVRLVSRDTDTFTSSKGNTLVEVEAGPNSAMLPGIDPPRHVHYRKLINQGFTVRNVQRLEPRMRKVARDIVADITAKGEFDAVTRHFRGDVAAGDRRRARGARRRPDVGLPVEQRHRQPGHRGPRLRADTGGARAGRRGNVQLLRRIGGAPTQARADRRHLVGAARRGGRR